MGFSIIFSQNGFDTLKLVNVSGKIIIIILNDYKNSEKYVLFHDMYLNNKFGI